MSDIILWRHADAEPGTPDLDRALTRRGEREARRVARWLHERLPAEAVIWTSPARRARQTALALARLAPRELVVVDAFAPSAPTGPALRALGASGREHAVVVVGHQPLLGELTARLLQSRLDDWQVRKGALVWLARRSEGEASRTVLRAAIAPDLV